MKLKKVLGIVLSMSFLLTFTIRSNAEDKEFIDINVTTEEEMSNNGDIRSLKSGNFSNNGNSTDELTRKRDSLIGENYNVYRNKIKSGAVGLNEYFKAMLNSEYGINNFFTKKFVDLSTDDILKKEIVFINFMNNNDCTFVNVQGFMPSYYNSFESLVFRKNNKQKDLIKQTKQMTEEELKKLFEFYLENIEDYLNSTKSSVEFVYQTVYPIGIDNLGDEFEKDIRNKYKEKSLEYTGENSRVKDFFELVNKDDTDKSKEIDVINYALRGTSIRRDTLYYARKYGYANDYARSCNPPYGYHNFSGEGGDCANFVSQCLHEGHIDFKYGSSYSDNRSWYFHNKSDWSASWIRAHGFRMHWQQRVPAHYMFVKDSLRFLDSAVPVSLLNRYNNYEAHHTVLPTDRHSNGYNFSYAAHSDSDSRTNLLRKLKENGDIKYYSIG